MFIRAIVKIVSLLLIGNVTQPWEATQWLEDNTIPYAIVEEMPEALPEDCEIGVVKRKGETSILYIKENVKGSSDWLFSVIPHEIVHMVRLDNGLWTHNQYVEEKLATDLMNETIDIIRNYPLKRVDEKGIWKSVLKVNNLEERPLSEEEEALYQRELKKTEKLLGEMYK